MEYKQMSCREAGKFDYQNKQNPKGWHAICLARRDHPTTRKAHVLRNVAKSEQMIKDKYAK